MKTLTQNASRITFHVSRTTQHAPRRSTQHATRNTQRPSLIALKLFLLLGLAVLPAYASVTLVSFTATPGNGQVVLRWETATEINNAGFFVRRSTQETGDYARISSFMPAQGDGLLGAIYVYNDTAVTNGVTYYYKLEAVDNSQNVEFHGPISATPGPTPTFTAIRVATATATTAPTSTPTLARTSTPIPMPTATFQVPSPTFTPTPTLTPTWNVEHGTPTPPPPPATAPSTPARTPTITGTATPILTPTIVSTSSPIPTPLITSTPTSPPLPAATGIPTPTRLARPTLPARPNPASSPAEPADWVRWLVFGLLSLATLLVAGGLFVFVRRGRR